MHELSIAEELLEIIADNAEKAGVRKVTEVNLRIGDFSGILPEALEFAFQVLSRGKITEGAVLRIEQVQPCLTCDGCGGPVGRSESFCPRCGSGQVRATGGHELEILSFEGE